MSLKNEQYNSLKKTRKFLVSIFEDKEKTKSRKVQELKRDLKKEAYSCLRHFPFLDSTGKPIFSNDEFYTENQDEITSLYNCIFDASTSLRLIAGKKRRDGTYNYDREACRHLAEEVLKKIEKITHIQ